MPKKETEKFVRENRDLLNKLVKHGDPSLKSVAAAFLAAVPPKKDMGENKE